MKALSVFTTRKKSVDFAGFIALNSGIVSGAQDILIPEQKDSVEDLCESLERSEETGKRSSS